MKKHIFIIFMLFGVLGALWGFLSFGTGIGFQEYNKEWEYRRMHPEFLPSATVVRAMDMGHSTSYASMLWLQFIQYFSDNLQDTRYLTFTYPILKQITDLHPYFAYPYEMNLLLSPFGNIENMNPEARAKNKEYIRKSILLGKSGIAILCKKDILDEIAKHPITDNLLANIKTKNPCATGTLPYYLGFIISQMGDNKIEAAQYYKIATAQDDGPPISRILGILALSNEGDHLASALNFVLVGSNGYDKEPFSCRNLSQKLIQDIQSRRKLDSSWINEITKDEKQLQDIRDSNNPISHANDNCYDMTEKGIREIFLAYITQIAKNTTATTGEDLIQKHLIDKIPTISSQSNYTVYLKDGVWQYRIIIK